MDPKDPEGPRLKDYYLSFGNIYLNAIPLEVTTYEDPINIAIGHRYKIKFKTSSGRIFYTDGAASLESIINDLNDRALVSSRYGVKDAMNLIINRFESDGRPEFIVSREIETPADGHVNILSHMERYTPFF